MVNISCIFSHKIPKYTITNAFTLTNHPQFHDLEMSLSNVLMIGLFCSSIRMKIFSKTEKKIISQRTCKGSYIYNPTWKGDVGLKACHMTADSFSFEQ